MPVVGQQELHGNTGYQIRSTLHVYSTMGLKNRPLVRELLIPGLIPDINTEALKTFLNHLAKS
jgi:hypothetical protein